MSKLDSHAIQAVDQQTIMGKTGTVTKLRLHSPTQAIDLLNKMDKIYTETPNVNIDNRTINIIVRDEEAAKLIDRIAERTRKLLPGSEDAAE